ncbi:GerMN domain-containing protein [Oscillibacter sp.]|uniref:GerMN domain-containing protein n=1 Tax=Oscillibacter sp. TaxID=1945593 RepID=UPI0028980C47|nr:GerMN domain-containing protein [Oscillibacter sp.]
MKFRGLLLLCALVLLPGCVYATRQTQGADAESYTLYYMVEDLRAAAGGDAVQSEPVLLEGFQESDTRAVAEKLTEVLLEGPRSEDLKSPFPGGTQLLSASLDDGHATVDLSYPYSTLSGVALTIADYCITLTLTQLPEIRSVSVTVRGQELAYRNQQYFTGGDLLLSSMEDVVSTVPVTLWFLNEAGELVGVQDRLDLYEGDTQLSALVAALEAGPTERGMISALPEGFTVLTTQLSDGVCYVNLSAALLSALPENADVQTALDALALSLTSLDAVQQVRYLMDGEPASSFGSASIAETYPREN